MQTLTLNLDIEFRYSWKTWFYLLPIEYQEKDYQTYRMLSFDQLASSN